jgi:hypothetical protein
LRSKRSCAFAVDKLPMMMEKIKAIVFMMVRLKNLIVVCFDLYFTETGSRF